MFKLIDNYLYLFGAKVVVNSWKVRNINNLLLIVYLYDVIMTIVSHGSFQQKQIFMGLSFYSFLIIAILNHLIFRSKRTNIVELLKCIESFKSKSVRQQMLKVTKLLLIVHSIFTFSLSYIFIDLVKNGISQHFRRELLNYYWWTNDISPIYQLLYYIRTVYAIIGRDHWINMTALPFAYYTISIELIKQDMLKFYMQQKSMDAKVLKQILIISRHVEHAKSTMNQLFGPFPLMWLSYLFLGETGAIQFIYLSIQTEQHLWLTLIKAIFFGKQIVFVFGVICLINHHISNSHQLCEQLSTRLYAQMSLTNPIQSNLITCLANQLQKSINYSACGLFDLNESLLLSFAAGLISFTVMFLQISA